MPRQVPALWADMITTCGAVHWRRLSAAAERVNAGADIPEPWWDWLAMYCETLGMRDALAEERQRAKTRQHRSVLSRQIAEIDRTIANEHPELLAFLKVEDVRPSPAGRQ